MVEVTRVNPGIKVNQTDYSRNVDRKMDKVEKVNNDIKETADRKPVDRKELKSAVEKADTVLFKNNSHLKFEIHERTKEVMVRIVDDNTGEVLKEIPPEKMLDMVAKMWETLGILVDEKR